VALWLDALGSFALAEFGFFIAILAIAYVYVWKKGALDWRT
jgi:NADH-quinone oxidoreductase subunit A